MGAFQALTPGGVSESTCVRCSAWVRATVRPAPNDIDVGGSAVALDCTGSGKESVRG
jgi:hypothetical protein